MDFLHQLKNDCENAADILNIESPKNYIIVKIQNC